MDSNKKLLPEFDEPTSLPDQQSRQRWQDQNRAWWEGNPMRYDWNKDLGVQEFSRPFYEEVNRRFFEAAAFYLPPKERPFDQIIQFDRLAGMDVLEIGVGNGSHAMLLAPFCKSYTGIDLTKYASASTSKRLALFSIQGDVLQMDAERMTFPDGSFDFIWSWGVIHHSANTRQVLAEMNRVLRSGGRATVMVYHRSFLNFVVFAGLFQGVIRGGFMKSRSLHELVQLHTDGALARYYRPAEWKALVESEGFVVEDERVRGQVSEVLPLPTSSFKESLMRSRLVRRIGGFLLNTCRQGSFLITTIRKI